MEKEIAQTAELAESETLTAIDENNTIDENIIVIEDDIIEENNKETPPEQLDTSAPQWVKDLRKQHREQREEIKRLRDELVAKTPSAEAPIISDRKKPTFSDCGYDEKIYDEETLKWAEEQISVKALHASKQEAENIAKQKAEIVYKTYSEKKQSLNAIDYDFAEENVTKTLNVLQQNIILEYADNSALVVLALGKNQKKADELKLIQDPIKFAIALKEFESKLKVERKRPPAPETRVSGSGISNAPDDLQLEALRKEAEISGDYTKVFKYKKTLKG